MLSIQTWKFEVKQWDNERDSLYFLKQFKTILKIPMLIREVLDQCLGWVKWGKSDVSPSVCPPLLTTRPVFVLYYFTWYNVQYIILPCCQPTLYLYCIVVFCITYNTKSSTTAVTTQNCPPSTYGTFACKIPPPSSFCCSKCSLLYRTALLYGISFSINLFLSMPSIIWCHRAKHQGIRFRQWQNIRS